MYQNLYSKISSNFSKQKGIKKKLIEQTINLGIKVLKKDKLSFKEKLLNYVCEILIRRKINSDFLCWRKVKR